MRQAMGQQPDDQQPDDQNGKDEISAWRERLAQHGYQYDPDAPPPPPPVECEFCEDRRFVKVDSAPGASPVPCPRCTSIEDRFADAGLARDAGRRQTFATFEHLAGKTQALRVVQRWTAEENPGLLISGPSGTGKSHLATARLVEHLRLGGSGQFVLVPELLDDLRAAIGASKEHGEPQGADQRADAILGRIARTRGLLVLDDVGAESTTPWTTERVFMVIDRRLRFSLPTVITTNLPTPTEIAHRLGQRVASRVGSYQYALVEGEDYRLRRGGWVQGGGR